MTLACPTHRELVERVLDERATDDELERYAAEVPDCAACRTALSRGLGVHPAVLRDGGATTEDDGRDAVLARLGDPEPWLVRLHRALTAEVPARRLAAVWVAAGIAAAAIVALALRPAEEPPPSPAPVAVAVPELPEPPAQVVTPPPSPEVPEAPRPTVAQAPQHAPEAEDDAVADAAPEQISSARMERAMSADWPPPPYVDLRGGTPKSGTPANAVRLQLDGDAVVGGSVGLVVTTGVPTELAVCVEGPERGVVWRGAVPSGRTVLTRDGLAQRFAFGEAGTWRFDLSTDATSCEDPAHVVTVEVR